MSINWTNLLISICFAIILPGCTVVNRLGHELVDATESNTTYEQNESRPEINNTTKIVCDDKTIYEVQKQLSALNYSPGPHDGMLGGKTAKAISLYQRDNNLKSTGFLNRETLLSLDILVPTDQNTTTIDNNRENNNKHPEKLSNIPLNHPFSKIETGMGNAQVIDLLGHPKDMETGISGKAYNPFYFGTDLTWTVYYYEKQGRVTFDGYDRIIEIEYDPYEDGYK